MPDAMTEFERTRQRIKAGEHPRDVLIDNYRDEWLEHPAKARARWRKWRGTSTGDAIEEGAARAGVVLPEERDA